MIAVQLPWPARKLSPNARSKHWGGRARATKAARSAAAWAIRAALGPAKPDWPGARVSLTFRPPDRRRRDLQNCIASAKALMDGIADAIGVDDSKLETSYRMADPVEGGSVTVEIQPPL